MQFLTKIFLAFVIGLTLGIGFLLFFKVEIKPRFSLETVNEKSEDVLNIGTEKNIETEKKIAEVNLLVSKVIPSNGFILPIKWGDLGRQLLDKGVIDYEKLKAVYQNRKPLSDYEKKLLFGKDNGYLLINQENAGFILNLLWAFGLANKSLVLEEMIKNADFNVEGLASVGGWVLSQGKAIDHLNKHLLVKLTQDQNELVKKVAENIYRPCCNNPTSLPDCNHGMAMLGLLELLAAQGVSEEEMYEIALVVNSYWFPSTYLTLAYYFDQRGIDWKEVDPLKVLGRNFSSVSGYQKIVAEVGPLPRFSAPGCGV